MEDRERNILDETDVFSPRSRFPCRQGARKILAEHASIALELRLRDLRQIGEKRKTRPNSERGPKQHPIPCDSLTQWLGKYSGLGFASTVRNKVDDLRRIRIPEIFFLVGTILPHRKGRTLPYRDNNSDNSKRSQSGDDEYVEISRQLS